MPECIVAKYLQKVSPEPFEYGVPRDRCAIIWTTWCMCEGYPGVLREEAERTCRTCFVSSSRARLMGVGGGKGDDEESSLVFEVGLSRMTLNAGLGGFGASRL
jgi:hypothetical protein